LDTDGRTNFVAFSHPGNERPQRAFFPPAINNRLHWKHGRGLKDHESSMQIMSWPENMILVETARTKSGYIFYFMSPKQEEPNDGSPDTRQTALEAWW
jgi:hypothetical protein